MKEYGYKGHQYDIKDSIRKDIIVKDSIGKDSKGQ